MHGAVLAPYRNVLSQRAARTLFAGFAAASVGDGMVFVVAAWLALGLAAPGSRELVVAAAVIAATLPAAVASLTLGRWLGTIDAGRLLLVDAGLRLLLLSTVAVLAGAHALSVELFLVLLGLSSVLHGWGVGARYALVGQLTRDQDVLPGYALISTQAQLGAVLGPALAGALIPLTSASAALGLAAGTYGLLMLALLRRGRSHPNTAAAPAAEGTADSGARTHGLRLLRSHPQILVLVAVSCAFALLYGPIDTTLPLYIDDVLGSSATMLGAHWTAFGLGGMLGSLLTGALARYEPLRVIVVVIAGWGIALTPFVLTPPAPVTIVALGLGGLAYGPFSAVSAALLRSAAPAHALTSLLAARSALVSLAIPTGAALGGLLTAAVGAPWGIFTCALGTIGLAIATYGYLRFRA